MRRKGHHASCYARSTSYRYRNPSICCCGACLAFSTLFLSAGLSSIHPSVGRSSPETHNNDRNMLLLREDAMAGMPPLVTSLLQSCKKTMTRRPEQKEALYSNPERIAPIRGLNSRYDIRCFSLFVLFLFPSLLSAYSRFVYIV